MLLFILVIGDCYDMIFPNLILSLWDLIIWFYSSVFLLTISLSEN